MDDRDAEVDCGSPLNPLANLDSLCASRICRTTDIKCGCTSDSHCPSSQVCYSRDNKCYSTLLELRTDPIEASACPLALELTEDKCLEAAGELEVGEFEGVWNRNLDNLPCGCFLWKYPDYNMVLYNNGQSGCSSAPAYNLGMIFKKVRLCFVIAVRS